MVDCNFWENVADDEGGGAAIHPGAGYVVNSLFAGNRSDGTLSQNGGGLHTGLDVVNCTFVGNEAKDVLSDDPPESGPKDAVGGGLYVPSGASVVSCILVGNMAQNEQTNPPPDWEVQQVYFDGMTIHPRYCNIEGFDPADCSDSTDTGCFDYTIDVDPYFVDPDGRDNDPEKYRDNDYTLYACSPCREAGDPNADGPNGIPKDDLDANEDENMLETTPDLLLNMRVEGFNVDMGAYEVITFVGSQTCAWDCQESGPDNDVGINDFLTLLAQWALLDCRSGYPGPVSCDQTAGPGVDINDFLALLANWGPCDPEGNPGSPPQSVQDCIDRFSAYPTVLAECICRIDPCTDTCPPDPTCN